MPIVLFRVDERLIHGQVVVGWGERLHVDRIIVVDEDVAGSPWEQELYCLGVPPQMEASFVTPEEAQRGYARWKEDSHRIIVLVRDVATLLQLADAGVLDGEAVNVGGIHHAPGRDQVLPYVFLNEEERSALRRTAERGVLITARDLPGSRAVPLDDLLRG